MTLADPLLTTPSNQQQHSTNGEPTITNEDTPIIYSTLDQVDPHHIELPASTIFRDGRRRRQSFLVEFSRTKGPPQLALLTLLVAIGMGSVIGVVPAVVTDRFARLHHGYDHEMTCSDYSAAINGTIFVKPEECLLGSADAQTAAATGSLISNTLTFFTSSWMGSLSDEYGRKGILIAGMVLSTLAPTSLVFMQLMPNMSPIWYYGCSASTGTVNWIAVALSAISDVVPPHWRAPSIGLFLSGFLLGISIAPTLALFLTNFQLSILAAVVIHIGVWVAVFAMPETLPPQAAMEALERRLERDQQELDDAEASDTCLAKLRYQLRGFTRPIQAMSILNRDNLFRLLSVLAFFSGMVSSADQTLLVYYVEEKLNFTSIDVSHMFLIIGIMGVIAQAVVLRPMNDCLGEKWLVAVCFVMGSVNNILYGVATEKSTILWAVAIGSFTGMAFPIISAIKANNVAPSEQGRIQGALYSLQALASGVGPIFLRYVSHLCKNRTPFGAGSMFVVAGMLYLVAVAAACALPKKQSDSRTARSDSRRVSDNDFSDVEEDMFPAVPQSAQPERTNSYGSFDTPPSVSD